MRVPPDLLRRRARNWRGPALAVAAVFVLLAALARAPSPFESFSSSQNPEDLAASSLTPGEDIPILQAIASRTVPLALDFPDPAPRPGARIAVMQRNAASVSNVVASDAWVAEADGNSIVLRLSEVQARALEGAVGRGALSYVEIPPSGRSPFAGP